MTKSKQYKLVKQNKSLDFDYIDQDGVSHYSPKEWLWDELGGCGCGSSDELAEDVWLVLKEFATDFDKRELDIYENKVYELIAHWLNDGEFAEHGISVGGSWLTEKGKQFYQSIKELI